MKITEETIENDVNRIKGFINKAIQKNKFHYANIWLRIACRILYNSNIKYYDCELEQYAHIIAEKTVIKKEWIGEKNKVVFYDYYSIDNRGLTEQYLKALLDAGYEVLYMARSTDFSRASNILNIVNGYINAKLVNVPSRDISQFIFDEAARHCANKFFVHTAPDDVEGIEAFTMMEGQCQRVWINLTDHAFWLGAKTIDLDFEFRDYGANISAQYREINKDIIFKLPYYPIVRQTIHFDGFNFDIEGKKLIVSGGAIYKIKGSDGFFRIASYILDNYDDTIILYVGNGDEEYINSFIAKNDYSGRFFYEKEREDIYQIIKYSFFFINTYPISGALILQMAMMCGKIPITINEVGKHADGDINELLCEQPSVKYMFSSIDDAIKAIDKYFNNGTFKSATECFNHCIISEETFNQYFKRIVENGEIEYEISRYIPDDEGFKSIYLNTLNEDKRDYYRLFLSKKSKSINIWNWSYFFRYIFMEIRYRILFWRI